MRRGLATFLLFAAAPASAEGALPVYPGAVHTRIGGDVVLSGEHHQIAYFTSGDSLRKVADHFLAEWDRRGLPTTADGDFENEAVVSAFQTREGLQQSVVLRTHQARTLGFVVLKDLWLREPSRPAAGPVAIEGALFSEAMASSEGRAQSQQESAVVPGDLGSVRAELLAKLGALGYRLTREANEVRGGRREKVVELARGREQLVSTLAEMGGGLTAVTQTWLGPAGGAEADGAGADATPAREDDARDLGPDRGVLLVRTGGEGCGRSDRDAASARKGGAGDRGAALDVGSARTCGAVGDEADPGAPPERNGGAP